MQSYIIKNTILNWIVILLLRIIYLRKYFPRIQRLYHNLFGIITRPNEYEGLSGASWLFMGAGVTVYLFDEKIAIIALLIMSLSDSAAALIGIKYGATRLFNKSLEGTLAFFITTFMILHFLSPASLILVPIIDKDPCNVLRITSACLND